MLHLLEGVPKERLFQMLGVLFGRLGSVFICDQLGVAPLSDFHVDQGTDCPLVSDLAPTDGLLQNNDLQHLNNGHDLANRLRLGRHHQNVALDLGGNIERPPERDRTRLPLPVTFRLHERRGLGQAAPLHEHNYVLGDPSHSSYNRDSVLGHIRLRKELDQGHTGLLTGNDCNYHVFVYAHDYGVCLLGYELLECYLRWAQAFYRYA